MHLAKIDRTLKERHDILRQLARLKENEITLDELEEIGTSLRRSGERALRLLVRSLWLEKSAALISRYSYLLDFFDNGDWLDHLMQIALKRRDLSAEAKGALAVALEGYGIDVSQPQFLHLRANAGADPLATMLDGGEEGLLAFLEQFLLYPRDVRLAVVGQMAQLGESGIVDFLDAVLRCGGEAEKTAALTVLGRIRTRNAAALLRKFIAQAPESLRALAIRSLRRLSFVGIDTVGLDKPAPALPFYRCCAGPPDGDGYRTLVFSRGTAEETFAVLFLQLHEIFGIAAAKGSRSISAVDLDAQLTELSGDEEVVSIDPGYALCLMQDALYRNRETETELPAEFYVYSGLFSYRELVPVPYEPPCGADRPIPHLSGICLDEIVDDPFFSCWFMTDGRVYDYAAEWRDLEEKARGREAARGLESILARLCEELFLPKMALIRQRLLLIADLMGRTGRDARDVEAVTAVARSLGDYKLPCHLHPFLRRFGLESMEIAREIIAEGFDVDRYQYGNDEWDD